MSRWLMRGLAATFAAVLAVAAFAQVQPVFPPRQFASQQTHYQRITVNFNACPMTATVLTCSARVGAVPYNSFLTQGWQQGLVAVAGATTLTASLGTASGGAQLVAATALPAPGAGTALTLASIGENNTGNGIAQTGANGGFDLWLTLTATGAPPTAGTAVMILEYIAPNDGACRLVGPGETAPGC